MYRLQISHPGLNRFRVITGATASEVEAKAQSQRHIWDEMYRRKLEAEQRKANMERQAIERERAESQKEVIAGVVTLLTRQAERAIAEAEEILATALSEGPLFDWESLKDCDPFQMAKPAPPESPTFPDKPDPSVIPPRPDPDDPMFQPNPGLLGSFIPGRKQRAIDEAKSRYDSALGKRTETIRWYNEQVEHHNKTVLEIKDQYRRDMAVYKQNVSKWQSEMARFETTQATQHQRIEARKSAYQNHDTDAVLDFCDTVLMNSSYPTFCPRHFDCDYEPETKTLIIDHQLPAIDDIPSKKAAKHDRAQGKIVYTSIPQSVINKLYEDVNYQIVLRTLFDLFHSDEAKALASIVFNGIVDTVDKSSGQSIRPCIMSIQVSRSEFESINLKQVDPKACFRKLKGVSATKLQALAPVAPVAQINREDKRFVESYGVAAGLDDSLNLASMD
jgi:restriction system protein